MANYIKQFTEACKGGQLELAKKLVKDHRADVNMDVGFTQTCAYGHIGIAKWLVHETQVDIQISN